MLVLLAGSVRASELRRPGRDGKANDVTLDRASVSTVESRNRIRFGERTPNSQNLAVPDKSSDESEFLAEPSVDGVFEGRFCSGCTSTRCVSWSAGIGLSLLRPHYGDNLAATTMNGDGANFETFTRTPFDYDATLSPRIWLHIAGSNGLGARVRYWQFDQSADAITAAAPANGFGRVFPPEFGNIDISVNVPGQSITATSAIDAHCIDIEGTQETAFGLWMFEVAGGLRYSSIGQQCRAQSRNAAGVLLGDIAFEHGFDGVGPTLGIEVRRSAGPQFGFFGNLRGSLLYGDGTSSLVAGEDLDLQTPFTTRDSTSRDDLLPIGEMQVGIDWRTPLTRFVQRDGEFFCRAALEGQLWQDAGNATSEEGNLGFFGVSLAAGITW